MLWPVLLALALTLSPRGSPAQLDCASVSPTNLRASVGYLGPPLDIVRDQARVLQTQANQLSAQPTLLRNPAWLTPMRATAASLRAAGLASQQYPAVPPALQGVDTLLTSAGAHLVGAMDDWTGGLDDEDEDHCSTPPTASSAPWRS